MQNLVLRVFCTIPQPEPKFPSYKSVFYGFLLTREGLELPVPGSQTGHLGDAFLTNLTNTRIDVLIADRDHMAGQLMASALRRCRNQFDVVVVATDSEEAIGSLNTHKPHVALVSPDLEDGAQTGFKVLQTLRSVHPETAGIMMLHSIARDSVIASFRAGARGIFCRADSFKMLSKCIRTVHEGKIWASTRELDYILDALTRLKPVQISANSGMALLTPSEQHVVTLVGEGMKNREIAQNLGLAEHTVSNYLYRIFDKLGVSSRLELLLYAMSHQNTDDRVVRASRKDGCPAD
jgi:DNA-binding NarL/FixJ family response regulator